MSIILMKRALLLVALLGALGACNATPSFTGTCTFLAGGQRFAAQKVLSADRTKVDHWEYKDNNQFTQVIDENNSDAWKCVDGAPKPTVPPKSEKR